ncbi:SDR family oxidoreductase [Pedobacter fastidiosus]|uniref:Aldehyde reductase n=1 Tax=Pedobacter fastidiosus TaxID=2765361 RepID=A0ABR7KYU9_9SPHI|nr:aldehyde reductase [Pedobacter fastidiosus]MBC6113000.1 aldehyde reductase [Pedobacter fastidiosus]
MENSETILMTGGTGFVGMQIVLQLLQKGYNVKTTVRSMSSKNKVLATLEAAGIKSFEKLDFIEAELTKDDNWAEAMKGCKYVISVASPVFFDIPKDENEAIRPAVEGIVRILKAAKNAGVKRVVMTSSFGAVGFSHTNKNTQTTEADWTDPNLKGLSTYEKSKGLSERAAWDFIRNEGGNLELSVINPVAILGPSLSTHISGSFDILKHMLDGSMKAIPGISLNIVDVRDVADLHIRAMTDPKANGERFIATADGQISMPEIAAFLEKIMPDVSKNVSKRSVPDWIINIASLFNSQAKTAAMFLNVNRNVSNSKAKQILGWKPIANNEDAIIASLESMLKFGIIK